MTKLFGKEYSKNELMQRIGSIDQVGGVTLSERLDGFSRGVRNLEFKSGSGLRFNVALERGMDIGECTYKGRSLAWIPPTNLPGPWFFEQQNTFGWLRTALGGFNNTCGMLHIGNPEKEDVSHYNFAARSTEQYGVHDRAAMLPATLLSYGHEWSGDVCRMHARGRVHQYQAYGENLQMTRTYTLVLGESRFFMSDEIENIGYLPTSHMYLYHINTGFPFVDNGSRFIAPFDQEPEVLFGNVTEADEYRYFVSPQRNWIQQTFQHSLKPDSNGFITVAIVTPDDMGLYLKYKKDQFPNYIEWRMMAQGQYAVGIEPCTNGFGRENEKRAGTLRMLSPGEKRRYNIEVGVVEGRDAINQLLEEIQG